MKELGIHARRWADSFGNTYFTAEIYIDDDLFHTINFEYGYDNHYEHVAAKYIRANYDKDGKQLPQEFVTSPSRYCRDNAIKFVSTADDVRRKKELHNGGKQ